MLNGTSIKAFAADRITLDVTGLVTGSDIGHDCQRYLSDEYDQNNHWQRCTICDKKYNVQPHTMTTGYWTGGNAQNCRTDNFFVRTCTNEHCGYETRTQTGRAEHKFSSEIGYSQYRIGYKICTVCGVSETVCDCTIHGKKPGCDVEGYCDTCTHYWQRMQHFTLADAIYDQHGNKVQGTSETVYNGYTTQHRCIYCGKVCMTVETTATQLTGNKVQYKLIARPLNGGKVQQILGPYFAQVNGQSLINQAMAYQISDDRSYATIWYTVTPQPGMHLEQSVWGYASIACTDGTGWPFGCGLYPTSNDVTNSVDVTAPQINSVLYKDISDATWTADENTEWSTSKQIKVDGHEEYANTVYLRLFDLDGQTDTTGYYKDLGDPVAEAQQAVGSTGQYTLQQMPGIEADENGHKYRLVVSDQLNNDVVKDITVKKIDRLAPKVATEDSTQTEWSKLKTVELHGTDKGINKVSVNFNNLVPLEGGSPELETATSGYSYSQEVGLTGDVYGQVAANVLYTDGLGNGTNKRLMIYNLDNTKPQVLSVDTEFGKDKTFRVFANDMHPTLGEGSHVAAYMIKQDNSIPSETDSNWITWTADTPQTGSTVTNTVKGYMEDSVNNYGVYYVFVKDTVGNISDAYKFEVKQRPRLYITATPTNNDPTNNVGRGYVTVDWQSYDWPNKYYKVYRQDDNGSTYQSVGVDYHMIKRVRVLQVFPDLAEQNNLHSWVVDTGYGQGIIQVDQVSQTAFNINPAAYLNENQSDGSWNYDVVFFGAWDRNNYRDLSAQSYAVVNKFASAGHGIILGHDTALNNGRDDVYEIPGGPVKHQQNYFDRLALDHIKILYYASGNEVGSTNVEIVKTGLFTTYPNYIGVKGTKLTIPMCHTWGQRVQQGYENNIWLEFRDDINNVVGHGNGNFYLVTYNNAAMIQTGHSNGAATSDEQKILQNLIFYMNQILFNMYHNVDYAAMDVTPPTTPEIQKLKTDYVLDSEDVGNNYKYYVEAYTKDGIAPKNYIETSNKADALVKTGLKGYYYVIDQNSQTVVTDRNGTYIDENNNKVSPGLQSVVRYLHVAAVDNGGNISATSTVEIPARITISYDKNQAEATGTMTDQIVEYGQSTIIKSNEFSWVKHRFTNWNINKDNSGRVFKPGDTVNYQDLAPKYGYNITMYAQWEPLYKLEIDPSKGEYQGDPQKQTFWLGQNGTQRIDDATRIGYNFKGWRIA